MGNSTMFLTINLARPEKEYEFHSFRRMTRHVIWEEIIPDDAPNDLKYRLKYGPSYTLMEYEREVLRFIEKPLRRPQVVYSDSRIDKLNEYTKRAFEISEFKLILNYATDFQQSGRQLSDQSLHWILEDLSAALQSLFASDTPHFDAVVMEYAM